VQSPCNPLIKDYTEIFYIVDEGDIPSIWCKMGIRGPKFMRKVDGLSLIFIDFYVAALTPYLSSTKNSLQLLRTEPSLWSVAYIQVSSTKRPRKTPGAWGVSFI
jgi:hypothetical protein